jgi:predicted ATPase
MISLTICFAAMIYALTGGPSSGKTSIIKELERRGEEVIHEAATDWIIEKIESGIPEPWKEENFTLDILNLQLEKELPWLTKEGKVFVDRGIFDIYQFAMANNLAGTKTLACVNKILAPIDLNQRYKAIFFIIPHSANFSSLQTEIRRENTQEAAKLETAAYATYCRHDKFIIVPGGISPAERADFILNKICEIERPGEFSGSVVLEVERCIQNF